MESSARLVAENRVIGKTPAVDVKIERIGTGHVSGQMNIHYDWSTPGSMACRLACVAIANLRQAPGASSAAPSRLGAMAGPIATRSRHNVQRCLR
jgi:hypothetical protein